MALPPVGISAAQIAQQKLQEQGTAQVKQGRSRFDAALEAKVSGGPEAASAAQAAPKLDAAPSVQQVSSTEQVALNRASGVDTFEQLTDKAALPVGESAEVQQSAGTLAQMLSEIERGQDVMDKLIKAGVSGKEFSSSELLALQASVYRYSQELELTGKVVEKATSGLKDTLKTQV